MITFEIEGTEYSIKVDAIDPNTLYRSYDAVINKVNEAGWEFTSPSVKPDYDELSNIARTSSGQDIALGDITDRVQEASGRGGNGGGGVTSDGQDGVDPDGEITVTVVGPDSRSEQFGLGSGQNLGSLKAKISERWDLGLSQRVELYEDAACTNSIEGNLGAESVDGERIHFNIIE